MEDNINIDKKQKQENWLELCDYIHTQILEYDKLMKFPRHMALRLRGLADGKFIANKNTKPQASYDYKTILYTFKICKSKIKEYMINNQIKIKDETHKINLIMMFVENEINDVVLRLQNAKKSEEKTENLELENQFNNGAEYQKKETKINKKLTELW